MLFRSNSCRSWASSTSASTTATSHPRGVKVGVVTSGGPAPAVGGNYCMALVDVNADENGKWAVVVRNKEIECEFAELPFYKRS